MDRKRKKHEHENNTFAGEEKHSEEKDSKKSHFSGDERRSDERRSSDRRSQDRRSGAERRKVFRRESDREGAEIGSFSDPQVGMLKSEIESKNDEAERFKDEIESLKDLLQRRQADFENYKKRSLKFQEEQKKFAIKDMALDIIMINDDLHRAVEASLNFEADGGSCEDGHKSFVDGVVMISKQIEEMLKKYGVIEIPAVNEKFNPNVHEAVEIELSKECDVDMVAKVYQKGFCIDDLVIRSAKVKVAKANKETVQGQDDQSKSEEEADSDRSDS